MADNQAKIDTLFQEVNQYMEQQNYDMVIAKCKEIRTLNPDELGAMPMLFHALINQKKFKELKEVAFEYYALTEDDDAFAMTWEALYFDDLNDEAIQFCDEILAKYPEYVRAWLWKGMNYNQLENIEKGFECWQEIPMNHPRYLDVLNNSGLVYESFGQTEEAKNYYKEVIDAQIVGYKAKAFACVNLGNLLQNENSQEAIKYYKRALKFGQNEDFSFPAPYVNIGDVYFKLKNYKLALENYQKSLEIDARIMNSHLRIAQCYKNLNDSEKSIAAIQKGMKIAEQFGLDASLLERFSDMQNL